MLGFYLGIAVSSMKLFGRCILSCLRNAKKFERGISYVYFLSSYFFISLITFLFLAQSQYAIYQFPRIFMYFFASTVSVVLMKFLIARAG